MDRCWQQELASTCRCVLIKTLVKTRSSPPYPIWCQHAALWMHSAMQGRQPPERPVLSCVCCLMLPPYQKRSESIDDIFTSGEQLPWESPPILQWGSKITCFIHLRASWSHICDPVNNLMSNKGWWCTAAEKVTPGLRERKGDFLAQVYGCSLQADWLWTRISSTCDAFLNINQGVVGWV